jgi:hypothetical protein
MTQVKNQPKREDIKGMRGREVIGARTIDKISRKIKIRTPKRL